MNFSLYRFDGVGLDYKLVKKNMNTLKTCRKIVIDLDCQGNFHLFFDVVAQCCSIIAD